MKDASTDQFSLLITGLDMRKKYEFGVLAYTIKGDGNASSDVIFPDSDGKDFDS